MMLDEFLEFLNTEELDSCFGLPDSKYMSLFEDEQLVLKLLDLEWNEATYKKLCFIGLDIMGLVSIKVKGEQIHCSKINDVYDDLKSFLLYWFYYDVQLFPFEMYSAEIKPGIDFFKKLAQKKALEKLSKNKTYQKLLQEAKQKMSLKLKSTEVLFFHLDQKWSANQYQNLISLLYLVENSQTFKWIHPAYHLFAKYMKDWSQMHYKAVPFEDWSDLAKNGVFLLKNLLKENRLDQFKKDSDYIHLAQQLKNRLKNVEERDYKQISQKFNRFRKPSKDFQKFIDVLNESNSDTTIAFYTKNKKDILSQVDLLCAVVNLKWSEKTHLKLWRLSWIIFSELQGRSFGEKKNFDILPIYENFQEYMYEVKYFGNKRIPFHEWEDLAKENADLLKALIQEGKFGKHKDDKRYLDLGGKYHNRNEELIKKGYTQLLYPEGT